MERRAKIILALGAMAALAPAGASAQQCKDSGALAFLASRMDPDRSLWLSATVSGPFQLEAAQQSQIVDQWTQDRARGLHLSASPVVSEGNGGSHKLYTLDDKGKSCLIDTQNQIRKFELPPNFTLPPSLRPGQIKPPIAIVPPSGGGGGGGFGGGGQVRPPIAIIPPGGGGGGGGSGFGGGGGSGGGGGQIQPPIAVLPPGGGGGGGGGSGGGGGQTRPPIAVLPPDGGGGAGGQIQPPIAVLPPDGGGSGGGGGGGGPDLQPSTGLAAGQTAGVGQTRRCFDPRSETARTAEQADLPLCPDPASSPEAAALRASEQAPLTPRRDVIVQTDWNAWSDVQFTHVDDSRFSRDLESTGVVLSFGADRRVSNDAVIGGMFALQHTDSDSFGGFLDVDSAGIQIGPYAAMRLSRNWSVDATLLYGLSNFDTEIVTISGDFLSQSLSGVVSARGQYLADAYVIRPEASVAYSYVDNDSADLSGMVAGQPVSARLAGDSFDYGIAEVKAEISRLLRLENNTFVTPFVEAGVQYEFKQPDDGQVLTGDLTVVSEDRWNGVARGGVRWQVGEDSFFEARVGYLSIGQSDLDVIEGGVFLSLGF